MYKGNDVLFSDFSGGLATAKPISNLNPNESPNLRNVVITQGKGIEKRHGNTEFNGTAMSSGAAVTGLAYYKLLGGSDFLLAIAGSSVFKSDSLDGTMDDITGAVSITSNQNNLWTFSQINDLGIFVGGAPNAPIKWNGTGNAAALGGTPPNGSFGFSNNNRMFIGGTSASPSTIYWSVLGNVEDWSSAGSGNIDIEKNDGDTLVGAAVLNNDTVLIFKQNSINQLVTRSAPFPYYRLFPNVGAVGKRAIVNVNGLVYFITPQGRMLITDGTKIVDESEIPALANIDDIWSGLNQSRLQYITGFYMDGVGFEHIVWMVSSSGSSTNDLALVWDIRNKCWLRHTTGYKGNSAARTQSGAIYTGHYNGKIYLQNASSVYADASEATPGAIDAYWSSYWSRMDSFSQSFSVYRSAIGLTSQAAGLLNVGYGYDYSSDSYSDSVSLESPGSRWDELLWDVGVWGGGGDLIRNIFTKGRGANFQISFSNRVATQSFEVHGYNLLIKKTGQKSFTVT